MGEINMDNNNGLEILFKRSSVRRYVNKPVESEKIEMLLKAAMQAPSAGNEQPWYFMVISERQTLDKLADLHPYAKMLKQAPLAIVVIGDPSKVIFDGPWKEAWIQDCSAATQNILLAATALDLGSVWLGNYPDPQRIKGARELLGIPENLVPFSIVSIGYPAENKEKVLRYEPSRVRRERWS